MHPSGLSSEPLAAAISSQGVIREFSICGLSIFSFRIDTVFETASVSYAVLQ